MAKDNTSTKKLPSAFDLFKLGLDSSYFDDDRSVFTVNCSIPYTIAANCFDSLLSSALAFIYAPAYTQIKMLSEGNALKASAEESKIAPINYRLKYEKL